MAAIGVGAQEIHSGPLFTLFYDSSSTYNGEPLKVGTVVDAFDQTGVWCGTDTVRETGLYGFMPVYGDDPETPLIDEGAVAGEDIVFKINDRLATIVSGDPAWADREERELGLEVNDVTFGIEAYSLPAARYGHPGQTIRIQVGVRNTGNGLDYYTITADNDGNHFWDLLPQPFYSYAKSGDVGYVYFDVVIPNFGPGANPNTISFTVSSALDPGTSISGTVDVSRDLQYTFDMQEVDPPVPQTGTEGDVITVQVGVKNTGDIFDVYAISATSKLNWRIVPQPAFAPADPGQTVYLGFEVQLPKFYPNIDQTDTIAYVVSSQSDPNVMIQGVAYVTNTIKTDVNDGPGGSLPDGFALNQNYPNPFNPTTMISFTLPVASTATIDVFNTLGQRVQRLDLGPMTSGAHEVEFDGAGLASGIYFYRLTAGRHADTRKMVLLK